MSSELKYTIDSFDEAHKILVVSYADGGWAQIQLMAPFPATEAEIDEAVKRFAMPVEAIQAKALRVDLSFVAQMVGVERTTTRRSMTQSAKPSAEEIALADAAAAASEAAEEARLRALIVKVLSENDQSAG